MANIQKIPDPIDERTTAEKIATYEHYAPKLPDTKEDRILQYKVGNIPKYALSQWEQREAKTGQSYTDYMGDVLAANKERIAIEAAQYQEKHRNWLNSLSPDDYAAELKQMEMKRIERMNNFHDEQGWSFEDTLAWGRKEGPKWEYYQEMGGDGSPGAQPYKQSADDKLKAAETLLWQNAQGIALTRLSPEMTDEQVLMGELSDYQKFAQGRYDWQFKSEQGIPWEENLQDLMLRSGVDFTGPILTGANQMTLDEYEMAGAFSPGDEFGWETARLYGMYIPEGSTIRVNGAADINRYTVITEDDDGNITETPTSGFEYQMWDEGETRKLDFSRMVELGWPIDELDIDSTYDVTLNENGMYQILKTHTGDWTVDNITGHAVHRGPDGEREYDASQMASFAGQYEASYSVITNIWDDLRPIMAGVLDPAMPPDPLTEQLRQALNLTAPTGIFVEGEIYEVPSFDTEPRNIFEMETGDWIEGGKEVFGQLIGAFPWTPPYEQPISPDVISAGTLLMGGDLGYDARTVRQLIDVNRPELGYRRIDTVEAFLNYAEDPNNMPDVLNMMQEYGDTPDTRRFLREFYQLENDEVTDLFSTPNWWLSQGLNIASAGFILMDKPGKIVGYTTAFVGASLEYIQKSGVDVSKESMDVIEAWNKASTPENPFGWLWDEDLHVAYNTMLPTAARVALELAPWIGAPMVGRGLYTALEIPMMVASKGTASWYALRLTRGSLHYAGMFDITSGRIMLGALRMPWVVTRVGKYAYLTTKLGIGQKSISLGLLSKNVGVLFMDKGLVSWLRNRAIGDSVGQRVGQIVTNRWAGQITRAYAKYYPIAEAAAIKEGVPEGVLPMNAATRAGGMVLDDLARAGGPLEEAAKRLASGRWQEKGMPRTFEAVKHAVEGKGWSLRMLHGAADKARIPRGEYRAPMKRNDIRYEISAANQETIYARNLNEVNAWVATDSVTGLVGRNKTDTWTKLLIKADQLEPEEMWLWNRLSKEITQSEKAWLQHLANQGMNPAGNMAIRGVFNMARHLEGIAPNKNPMSAIERQIFDEVYGTATKNPIGQAYQLGLAAEHAGKVEATALFDRWKNIFNKVYNAIPGSHEWNIEAVNKALAAGKVEVPSSRIVSGGKVVEYAPSTYGEMTNLITFLDDAIERMNLVIESPSFKGSAIYDSGVKFVAGYNKQRAAVLDVIDRVNSGDKLTIDDAMTLDIAIGHNPQTEKLKVLMRPGAIVNREFYEHAMRGGFNEITGYNAHMSTPMLAAKFINGGMQTGPFMDDVFRPAQNAMMLVRRSNQLSTGIVNEIASKYNITGSVRKVVLYDIMKAFPSKSKFTPAVKLAKDKKFINILKGHQIDDPARHLEILGAAAEIRILMDDVIVKLNLMRGKLDRPLIKYQSNYMSDIKMGAYANKVTRYLAKAEVNDSSQLMREATHEWMIPNASRFERAMAKSRWNSEYEKETDVIKLIKMYFDGAHKDIYFTPVIANNKVHAAAFRSLDMQGFGGAGNAKWIDRWTAEALLGMEAKIDRVISDITEHATKRGDRIGTGIALPFELMNMLRAQLNHAVFPLNIVWTATIQTSSLALTIKHTGVRNTAFGGYSWFTNYNGLRDKIKLSTYSYQTKADLSSTFTRQDMLRGAVDYDNFSPYEKMIHHMNYAMRTVEAHLTGISIAAGYRKGTQLGFKGGELWAYASDVGAQTQSMYNPEDVAGIMRNRFVGVIYPFQTFTFEMFNAARELAGIRILRTGAYHTVAATSATGQATLRRRMYMLTEWAVSAYMVNEFVSRITGRNPYWIPSAIPFWNMLMFGFDLENEWGAPLPYKFVHDFQEAVVAWFRYGDSDKLRSLLLKYIFPGGVQINRFIEGTFALRDEEHLAPSGDPVIEEISNETFLDVIQALTLGPWGTDAGQAQLDEWAEDEGWMTQWTGIELWDTEGTDVKHLSNLYDGQLGGMVRDEDKGGNASLYTTKRWASDMIKLRQDGGLNKMVDATEFGRLFLSLRDNPIIKDYEATYGKDGAETLMLRNDFLDANPIADAFEFMFGDRVSLRTSEGLKIVEDWMDRYQIPPEAIDGLEDVNTDTLRFNDRWGLEVDRYELSNDTFEGRDEFFGRRPEFARDFHKNKARAEDVPAQWIDAYADYYVLQYPSFRETKYDDEWFLMDNYDFYLWLRESGRLSKDKEWWRYPASPKQDKGVEWDMLQRYETTPVGDARLMLRCQQQAIDSLIYRMGMVTEKKYGSPDCARVINEYKEPSPWAGEATAGVEFPTFTK